MNKTIIINITGIVFHIEEEAYDVLRSYMIDVKKYFGHSADSHEIVGDIENRIAEMFNERIVAGKKEVITMSDVQEVIDQMGQVSDFAEGERTDSGTYEQPYSAAYESVQRKLMRDPDDRVFGGVCSGLGHYFGIEARWVRLLLVLLFIFGGTGLLLYIILWIVIPVAKTRADRMAMRGEAANIRNFQRSFQEEMEGLRSNFTEAGGSARTALHSAGSFIASAFVVIAKIIGVFFIFGICVALVVLLVSIFATFGVMGWDNDMIMFPVNVVQPEIRNTLLISALLLAAIPLIALIGVIVRILFNRVLIGRYTGFTLLAIWIVAAGLSIIYGVETANDFREESTVVEVRPIEALPEYTISLNDMTVIKLEDSTYADDRLGKIRRTAVRRNSSVFHNHRKVSLRINKLDSLQQASVTYEYSARGKTYDQAAERAGNIQYHLAQNGGELVFDSHFHLEQEELMRDQDLNIRLNLPVGTVIHITREMNRYLSDLPINQCTSNFMVRDGYQPEKTTWIMTQGGLKCMVPDPVEEPQEDSLEVDNISREGLVEKTTIILQ